jgi:hypothetical protein
MATATPPTPPANPGLPCEHGPRYSVAIPYVTSGATQWHPLAPERAPLMRGNWDSPEAGHAWARKNIPGCAYEVVRTDAPTSLAPTFPCVVVLYTVSDTDGWSMSRATVIPAVPGEAPEDTAAALATDADDVFWPSHDSPGCAGTDWGSVEVTPNVHGDGRTGYSLDLTDGRAITTTDVTRLITLDGCTLCETLADLEAALAAADDAKHPPDRELNTHLPWTAHRWVRSWEWRDHGVNGEQYWQGAGVSFTRWQECYTGIGDSPREAAEDAAEQAASNGWSLLPSCEAVAAAASRESKLPALDEDDDACEMHHYVVLYVSAEPDVS